MSDFPAAFIKFLSESVAAPLQLLRAERLPGGASLETWAFTVEWEDAPRELVVRRDTESRMHAGALSRADEFALSQVGHRHGVFVPRPLFLNTTDPYPYFVVERHAGTSIGAKVVRDPALAAARERLPPQLAGELAKIHALPLEELPFLPRPVRTPADELLTLLRENAERLDPANPVWAYGLRWLERHAPPAVPLAVVHGDYRIGNVLVTAEGLNGILDWEFAHLGDPAEDIAWLAVRDWRFGQEQLPIGGIGRRADFLDAYRASGAPLPTPDALRWWEIAGNLKWAIFCLAQAERHLSGKEPNIEYAALGRRAPEMEWEMLRLIEGGNEWG